MSWILDHYGRAEYRISGKQRRNGRCVVWFVNIFLWKRLSTCGKSHWRVIVFAVRRGGDGKKGRRERGSRGVDDGEQRVSPAPFDGGQPLVGRGERPENITRLFCGHRPARLTRECACTRIPVLFGTPARRRVSCVRHTHTVGFPLVVVVYLFVSFQHILHPAVRFIIFTHVRFVRLLQTQ